MIEIGQISEFEMSYDEAVMYCFLLGDGWRMPTEDEYDSTGIPAGWFLDDLLKDEAGEFWAVTPVRDKR